MLKTRLIGCRRKEKERINMRGKSLEVTTLFLTTLIVVLGISPAFSATGVCPIDAMNYEPASTTWATPAHSLGDIFNITVMAYNLVDFRIWSTGIKYDPAVLNWTGFTWGDMDTYVTMHPMLGYMPGTVNTTSGESTAFAQAADVGQYIATMASLKLITHHFEVVGYGTTAIEHFPVPMCNVANIEDETYYGVTDFTIMNSTFSFTPAPVHDVAVTNVSAPPEATQGDTVTINVDVANEGDFTETFSVTIRYDTTDIDTKTVTDLSAGGSTIVSFDWDVRDVALSTYKIEAEAILAGDDDPADNKKTSDWIDVVPEFPTEIILLLVLAILAVSTVLLKRRTQRHPLTGRLRRYDEINRRVT